jgi:hypothetical protein
MIKSAAYWLIPARVVDLAAARKSYYDFIGGSIDKYELAKRHPSIWSDAGSRVMCVELGSDKSRLSVHRAIQDAVAGNEFVLIGRLAARNPLAPIPAN